MAWTNVFDIGSCTLTVYKNGSDVAMTAGEIEAESLVLSADAAGLVTLSATPEPFTPGVYEVRVIPDYDTGAASVRIVVNSISGTTLNGVYPAWSPEPQTYSGAYPTGTAMGLEGQGAYDGPIYDAFAPTAADWAFVSATVQAGGSG